MAEVAVKSVKAQNVETGKKAPISSKATPELSQSMDSPVEQVLHLQRAIGNQAVNRLIQFGSFQTKSKIGSPDDIFEEDANCLVGRMMSIPAGSVVQKEVDCSEFERADKKNESRARSLTKKITPLVQRQLIQRSWYDWLPAPTDVVIRGIINQIVDKWIPRNDPGRWLGQDLIEHYAFGASRPYIRKDGIWGVFMKKRPELKEALNRKMKSVVKELYEKAVLSGKFSDNFTGVKLNELASMRMTLHGCHHIDIKDDFRSTGSCPGYITFNNLKYTWVDKGKLHPGTKTELDDGTTIDDSWFKKLARYIPTAGPFDIKITWSADSKWFCDGTTTQIVCGWPSSTPSTRKERESQEVVI